MKTVCIGMMAAALALGLASAQAADAPAAVAAPVNPALVKAEAMAKATTAKVLAVKEDEKAAQVLVEDLRAMLKDEKNEAVQAGAPELTIATLVKTDMDRAMKILPLTFLALTEGVSLEAYQRLVASALMASGDSAAKLTDAILLALSGMNRWIELVMVVAKDTPRPLPVALSTAIQAISPAVLPPAVIPPGPYEGQ